MAAEENAADALALVTIMRGRRNAVEANEDIFTVTGSKSFEDLMQVAVDLAYLLSLRTTQEEIQQWAAETALTGRMSVEHR